MKKREPLDVAFVLIMTLGAVLVIAMAANQESFVGIVDQIATVRKHVPLRPGDDARILAGSKSGFKYVLVDQDGIYPLQGDQERVGAFTGQEATVIGSYANGAIHVSTAYRSKAAEKASH
jgi:hypothetical protein